MRDFFRFVLRGSWASAIFMLVILTLHWGSLGAFIFLSPYVLIRCAFPGAVVGIVLWIVAGRTRRRLTWIVRVAIGSLVGVVFLFLSVLCELLTTPFAFHYADIVGWLTATLIYAAGFGGLSGSACPGSRKDKAVEDQPTYRERAKLYEEAEREARAARMRTQNRNAAIKTFGGGWTKLVGEL